MKTDGNRTQDDCNAESENTIQIKVQHLESKPVEPIQIKVQTRQVETSKNKRGRPTVYERDGMKDIGDMQKASASIGSRGRVNEYYAFEGISIITEAATEIPHHELIYYAPDNMQFMTHDELLSNGYTCKKSILEQIGRMSLQDGCSTDDCVAVLKWAAESLNDGMTVKEIAARIRKARKSVK